MERVTDQAAVAVPRVPESGQVVNVRGATWAVTGVKAQGSPRALAGDDQSGLTHVVRLQSLEEDQLGDELAVVWELETGHTLAPDQGLPETISPDRFDDPNTLAAFVDAVRWGAVTSADERAYQAPFRSGANVEAYQLEPLRRALQSARTNLLLADDVGLGKTIEAGLVIQELLLRHRARSVIIVCPPSLQLKWQDEMREKFGLHFEIVNSELMARVLRSHGPHANPFRLYPRVIVSMAWLPGLRAQRLLRDVYADVSDTSGARRYAFDVLVVDEAHHVAPASPSAASGFRGYAVDSDRTMATRALAEKCEHRLFLSATPHNGYSESFTALMEMIDGRRFQRGATLDERALGQVAVRRLKADLREQKGFQTRELKSLPFLPDDDEVEKFALLDRLLAASAKANGRNQSGGIVAMLLKKRFLSSPWSFAQTLYQYLNGEGAGRGLEHEDEEEYYQEVLGSGQSDEEEGDAEHPEFTALRRSKRSDPLVAATDSEIADLIVWGQGYEHRPDARLSALIMFLDAVCRIRNTWSNERVVVFTEYAATLDWIVRILGQRGYRNGIELAVIQGSTSTEERELIRKRFSMPPEENPVRVLVATDSAGEGIDLQDYCHRLVNFDIPFNPSRLEQRIGRVDRYGQKFTPEIYQFVPVVQGSAYARDVQFLVDIVRWKLGKVAADLGSANQVVDARIQDHFTAGGTGRRNRRGRPDEGNVIIGRALAGGGGLDRALTELSRTFADRKADMHLTAENARRVVDTALAGTGQPPLLETGDDRTDAQVFALPALSPAWQPTLRGLEATDSDGKIVPGQFRRLTFDDEAARDRNDLVHIHLGHALMQRSARILRSALFSVDSPVNRVTAVVVDGLPQSCAAAVSRLVLVGRGGLRLHEEVFLTGIRIRGQALSEEKAEEVLDRALDAQDLVLADERTRGVLADLWNGDGSSRPLRDRLRTAMTRKAQSLQEKRLDALAGRRQSDIRRAEEIFAAFRVILRESRDRLEREIRTEDELLFTDDQQRQRRHDLSMMIERLERLDGEERRELDAIKARYADIRPHVTAAAIVFALTPTDALAGRVQL